MQPSSSCAVALPRDRNNATSLESATETATSKADNTRKPSSLRELRVQLRAQLTRNNGHSDQDKQPTELRTPESASETDNLAHFAWRIHFADRNPLRATFSPEVTHTEVLACYPDAVAAEPLSEELGSKPAARCLEIIP